MGCRTPTVHKETKETKQEERNVMKEKKEENGREPASICVKGRRTGAHRSIPARKRRVGGEGEARLTTGCACVCVCQPGQTASFGKFTCSHRECPAGPHLGHGDLRYLFIYICLLCGWSRHARPHFFVSLTPLPSPAAAVSFLLCCVFHRRGFRIPRRTE